MPQPTDDISRAVAYALDPVLWTRDVVGWTPDPWQASLLHSEATQLALCCGRQVGKSSVVALLACHTAVVNDDALIILIAPSQRQSRELAIKVGSFLGSIEPHEELEEWNKLSIRLARTRSRIVALPGHDPKTIRGFSSPRLIVIDEAAFVLDETYAALVPMLAASPEGRIALLSTRFLQQGFFTRSGTAPEIGNAMKFRPGTVPVSAPHGSRSVVGKTRSNLLVNTSVRGQPARTACSVTNC
jgi:hypothetical protein